MGNLNAENLTNEIQSLIKALKDCGGWVKRGNGEGWFNHEILEDALALINSQEQRIKELTEERDGLENLAYTAIDTQNCMSDTIEELTEENERLKLDVEVCGAELSRYTENIVQMAKQDRADTVRKMQERSHDQFHDRVAYTRSYVHDIIDQIAKEMLEENENETTHSN